MPPTPRNDNAATGNAIWIALAVGLVWLFAWLIWENYREYIAAPLLSVKWVEIKIYESLVGLTPNGRAYLDLVESYFDGRRSLHDITWGEFGNIYGTVSEAVKFGVTAILGGFGLLTMFVMRGDGFKRVFKLRKLADYQATYWKVAAYSSAFDMARLGKTVYPALTPAEWMIKIGLKDSDISIDGLTEQALERCRTHFAKQLGKPWTGIDNLPIYVQCLIIMFATHASRRKNKKLPTPNIGLHVRQQVAVAYTYVTDPAKRDKQLHALIAPYLKDEPLLKPFVQIGDRHAFITTALIEMLKHCRLEAAVLPSADFNWLKGVDRDLWYALNNTGRKVCHIEAAGIFDHYQHEMVMRQPMPEPQVDNAVEGLEEYIQEQGIVSLLPPER